MVRYKIVTCLYGVDPIYQQMLEVLRWSAHYMAPDAELVVHTGELHPPRDGLTWWHAENTAKLDTWVDACLASDIPVVCIDSDTVVLGSLWEAFAQVQDVGITTRAHAKLWFNAGVFFYQPTPAARQFVQTWRDQNQNLYTGDKETLEAASQEFNGMNQPALLATMRQKLPALVALLPGEIWNCCAQEWWRFKFGLCKVLHVQPGLRKILFQGSSPLNHGQAHAAHVWRACQAAAHHVN